MFGKPGPMEAVAEVGEKILLTTGRNYYLYYVAYRETIPVSHPLVIDLSAGIGIAAGVTPPVVNTRAILDMADGQLGIFRSFVLDDIHVQVLQPQQTGRMGLFQVNATINAFSRLEDPDDHLTELAIFEDDRFFLQVTNPTRYAVVQARIAFYGHKYVLEGRGRVKGGVQEEGGTVGSNLIPLNSFKSIEAVKKSGERYAAVPTGGWDR